MATIRATGAVVRLQNFPFQKTVNFIRTRMFQVPATDFFGEICGGMEARASLRNEYEADGMGVAALLATPYRDNAFDASIRKWEKNMRKRWLPAVDTFEVAKEKVHPDPRDRIAARYRKLAAWRKSAQK